MKKMIVLAGLLLALLVPGISSAGIVVMHDSFPATESYTLFSAVTATGAGTAQCLVWRGYTMPTQNHNCTATWSGTAPTNIVFNVNCGESATKIGNCSTQTMTASPWVFQLNKPATVCMQGDYVSKSGGDGTTALTLTCTSGGI